MKALSIADIADMERAEAEIAIRSRVQTTYLGHGRALSRILGHPKIYLSTDDVGFAGNVMLDGFWEIWLTLFFARYLRRGMTVIDVGANFGYYTILFGEAVGLEGRVIAIEPVPDTVSLLARSVELNGHSARTKIIAAALGRDGSGEAHIFVPENEPKNATVVNCSGRQTVTVPSTNLNNVAKDLDQVHLIKIDVEGAEADVVEGMMEVIHRYKPDLLLEFNAARYKNPAAFIERLKGISSRFLYVDFNGKLVSVSGEELLQTHFGEDWLLFVGSSDRYFGMANHVLDQ